MRALAGGDPPLHAPGRRIDHGDIVGAHVGHQHLAVLPQHAGRRRARPARSTARSMPRRSIAARWSVPCRLTKTVAASGENARWLGIEASGKPLHQLIAAGFVDVDLVARQAVHHEVFAVRAKTRSGTGRRPECGGAPRSSRGRERSARCRRCRRPADSRPSGVSATWCGSRSTGMRRSSVWVARSITLSVASLEFITSTAPAARASWLANSPPRRSAARKRKSMTRMLSIRSDAFF